VEDQPYAPPASGARASNEGGATLPKTPVALTVLLSIVTLGLYIPYWFLSRRRAFNRLAPEGETVDRITFFFVALYLVAFAIGFASGVSQNLNAAITGTWYPWLRVIDLASRIFTIVISFRIKFILEASYPERLSGLGTFFLSLFYLQYKINRLGNVDPISEHFTLR
jgi:Domain of unknown function (DUF4234)